MSISLRDIYLGPDHWQGTVWLPGRWPGYNELIKRPGQGHWAKVHQMKMRWQEGAGLLIKAAKVPKLESANLAYLHFRTDRRHDPGNLAFGASKIIEDALQDVGVLESDGWNYITSFSHDFQHTKKKEGVELSIRGPLRR